MAAGCELSLKMFNDSPAKTAYENGEFPVGLESGIDNSGFSLSK
jgi:hypothetical protein